MPANANYPPRAPGTVGPLFNAAFWGGSLLLYCADPRNTGDPRSHYGPQCMCPHVSGVLNNGHHMIQGEVSCLGELLHPNNNDNINNNVFLHPQYADLRILCLTHCHCSHIVPQYGSVPPGDRRPDYSSVSSEGSSSPSLRLPPSSNDGHSGSDVDIMSRDLVNRAWWEKSTEAGESAISERGGQRAG